MKELLLDLTIKLKDVTKLVSDHNIESKLYSKHEVSDIMCKFPSWFTNAWFSIVVKFKEGKEDKEIWTELIKYLEKQAKVQKVKAANEVEVGSIRAKNGKGYFGTHYGQMPNQGGSQTGVNGCPLGCKRSHTKLMELTECSRFLRIRSPSYRLSCIKKLSDRYCFQCLRNLNNSEHDQQCDMKYSCQDAEHKGFQIKFHVLLCQNHCQRDENLKLFDEFKAKKFKGATWCSNICLSFFAKVKYPNYYPTQNGQVESSRTKVSNDEVEVRDQGLYLLQTIVVDGKSYYTMMGVAQQ